MRKSTYVGKRRLDMMPEAQVLLGKFMVSGNRVEGLSRQV